MRHEQFPWPVAPAMGLPVESLTLTLIVYVPGLKPVVSSVPRSTLVTPVTSGSAIATGVDVKTTVPWRLVTVYDTEPCSGRVTPASTLAETSTWVSASTVDGLGVTPITDTAFWRHALSVGQRHALRLN